MDRAGQRSPRLTEFRSSVVASVHYPAVGSDSVRVRVDGGSGTVCDSGNERRKAKRSGDSEAKTAHRWGSFATLAISVGGLFQRSSPRRAVVRKGP